VALQVKLKNVFIVREGRVEQYVARALEHARQRYGIDGLELQKVRDTVIQQFAMGGAASSSEPPDVFVDRMFGR
jgi:hypothetical protein